MSHSLGASFALQVGNALANDGLIMDAHLIPLLYLLI